MRQYRASHAADPKPPVSRYRERGVQYQEGIRAKVRQQKTGHTPDYFKACVSAQLNRCAICVQEFGGSRRPQADHDHSTGNPRGVLCTRCNQYLGWVERHPALLTKILDYLEEYKGQCLAQPGYLNRDAKHRWINTGHTPEYYLSCLEKQGYTCVTCGCDLHARKAHADHDHATGLPRGVLCVKCNLLVGKTECYFELLEPMRNYLKRYL
jgi:hypothetical protein